MTLPDALWNAPPFDRLDTDERVALEAAGALVIVEAGQPVYRSGDASTGAFVLLEGRVELSDATMSTLRGRETFQLSVPGTLLSKGALLDPTTHRRACVAVERTTLLHLERGAFQGAFLRAAPFARALIDHIVALTSAEVRELNAAIHTLLSEPS